MKYHNYLSGFLSVLIILLFLSFESCIDLSRNFSDLPQDLRTFVTDNTDDLYTTEPIFLKRNGQQYAIDLDTVKNEDILSQIIAKENLLYTCQSITEREFSTDPYIFQNLSRALQIKADNPWKITIPDSISMNYLLPYKVLFEKTGGWQEIFQRNFADVLSFIPSRKLSKKQIDSLIETHVIRLDTGHIFTGREGKYRICEWPGILEILMEKSGDCQSESIKNVYLYRSLGIPAAMDFTPFYGGGNAGHSTAVSWDSDLQKFRPKAGQGFNKDYRVAKVFRWTFKKSNNWERNIVPLLNSSIPFPIQELQNNHWIDATKDHTTAKDLTLNMPEAHGKIAFICTYSYGEWRPIFYGVRTSKSVFLFKDMALDVLYRGGYYDKEDRFVFEKSVFILGKDGKPKIINKTGLDVELSAAKIKLERNNYGSEAWIKKNRSYSLLALNTHGEWDTIYSKWSTRDSLITFPEFKSKYQIFALMEHEANRRLERPFYILKDSIVWY
ncbi:hypothetical protein [Sphingobacterium spiritivorum]|uniref:hypothetical protein n=1 Tax=Sphingobacterium spiritivorum TaxID=258 RepID=UPI003DA264B1